MQKKLLSQQGKQVSFLLVSSRRIWFKFKKKILLHLESATLISIMVMTISRVAVKLSPTRVTTKYLG